MNKGEFLQMGIDGGYGNALNFKVPVIGTGGAFFGSGLGKVFFVDSNNGAATHDGRVPTRALTTVDAAIGKCTANKGDVIVLLPGHSESISDATGLVADIAGVSIVGIGEGSLRPKIQFGAAAASIVVSAANVTFTNIVFEANFADVAEAFTPSAKWLTIRNCEFLANATNKNFLSLVDTGTTNNQCDGLTLENCIWIEPDTATLAALSIDADLDRLTVDGCYFNLGVHTSDLPIIAIVATGKDLTNARISNNKCIRLNDANPLLITADTTTANTGVVYNNYVRHLDTDSELLVTAGTNFGVFENKATAAVDASGYILPAVDS